MSAIDRRLTSRGIALPAPLRAPVAIALSFAWVNVRGDRAYISGHGPLETDGAPAGPFGALGNGVSVEQGQLAARRAGLAMLASLRLELGSLDRIASWCRVHGMVNCVPGFQQPSTVMNGFSDLMVEVFGAEVGRHARTAVGVAGLPFDFPVEIEAEVLLHPG
ncbi:MAG: RidA family protein [Pseudomonadota bacterium]|nr:RidA family protein [Pseudomonadota bacterium]